MEKVDEILKRTLSFISIVQHACNQKRLSLEQVHKEVFSEFIKARKEHEKEEEKKSKIKLEDDLIQEKMQQLEIKEMLLADKLLQKARSLREKVKVSVLEESNDIVNTEDFRTTEGIKVKSCSSNVPKSNSLNDKKLESNPLIKAKNEKQILKHPPRKPTVAKRPVSNLKHKLASAKTSCSKITKNKSDAIVPKKESSLRKSNTKINLSRPVKNLKTSVSCDEINFKYSACSLPLSERTNVLNVNSAITNCSQTVKNELFTNAQKDSSAHKNNSKKCSAQIKSKTLKIDALSGEKNSETNTYLTPLSKETSVNKELINNNKPGLDQNLSNKKMSEVKSFQEYVKNKLYKNQQVIVDLGCIWYPFLNTKNKRRLSHHIICRNTQELKSFYDLIHKVQEMMFWLDLYFLMGKSILPYLNELDKNDMDVSVLHSYIQSLFHESLQRTPMIIQSDSSQ